MNEYPILQYFDYAHLPEDLRIISKRFHDLAHNSVIDLPTGPEVSAMLRKLLEAKDCAVRAKLK